MDDGLPHHRFFIQSRRIHEGEQQMDGGDGYDGDSELDFEHRGIDVGQPFGFVGMAFQPRARNESFVAAARSVFDV